MSSYHHNDRQYYELRREIDSLKRRLDSSDRQRKRTRRLLLDAEEDILLLGVLSRSLLEVLIERKLCTMDDIAAHMERLDHLDGEADGGLDPSAIAAELGIEQPEIDKAKRFARSFESRRRRRRAPAPAEADEPEEDDVGDEAAEPSERVKEFSAWLKRRRR